MYTDWGSFFDDNYFDDMNFYSAARWVWGKYLSKVVKLDKVYSEEDMDNLLYNLIKIIAKPDFIEKTRINYLFDLETTLDTAEYILAMAAKGLNEGAFFIQDLIDNQVVVAKYILIDNINIYYEYEFIEDNLTGEELLLKC